jgi:hypothetical protein
MSSLFFCFYYNEFIYCWSILYLYNVLVLFAYYYFCMGFLFALLVLDACGSFSHNAKFAYYNLLQQKHIN